MKIDINTMISDTQYLESFQYKLTDYKTESFLDIIWCIYTNNNNSIKIIREKGFYEFSIIGKNKISMNKMINDTLNKNYINEDFYGERGYKKMLNILEKYIRKQNINTNG